MWKFQTLAVVGCLMLQRAAAIWSCSSDEDCGSLAGGVCAGGACACPVGRQPALGGSICADVAPYFTSQCVEDFQCARMFTSYQCSLVDNQEGSCRCQAGSHYFHGRCWPSQDFAESCTRDEECQNVPRNPYSMSCLAGVCACADGYYLRQRGECRKLGLAVGDGCVLDVDCQFQNGACDRSSLTCYDTTVSPTPTPLLANATEKMATTNTTATNMVTRQHGIACAVGGTACPAPFECSSLGICICPLGYYNSEDGTACLAELGSPASEEQCTGLFAEIQDGVCRCPANFYFDDNMRDCVKASLRLSDSCVTDAMCHTFGAATECGEPQAPWGIRSCSCIPELAVWDEDQQMCRLFVGIGEQCEVDSDCLAGDVEVLCQDDGLGTRRCACPPSLTAVGGLCLTTGLGLGESCQVSQECSGAENSACVDGSCACAAGYQQSGDLCSPEIGSACASDSDCLIENTVCLSSAEGATCQCGAGFAEYSDACWPESSGYNSSCAVSAQCAASLGAGAECSGAACACSQGHHYRGGRCWPITGLFEACTRSSECYLGADSALTVCRNGLCQCDFLYPYSEDLNTCVSGAPITLGSMVIVAASIVYLFSNFSH